MTNGESGQPAATPAEPAGTPAGTPGEGGQQPAAGGEGIATGSTSEGAAGGEHWLDGLGEGVFDDRDATILRRFGDIGELAKGYINAFNLVSRDKIPMPQNEQEFMEVYNRLGRPQEASEYSFDFPEGFPEVIQTQMEKNQDWFKLAAHNAGLNKTQAAKLYGDYVQLVKQQVTAQNDRIDQEMTAAADELKSELGEAFDGKMVLANRAISEVGGEELIDLFERTGMGRNPTVVKAFIRIGEMISEETGLDIEGRPSVSTDELDAQIAEIQSDPAYMDAKDPQHKVLVDKMQKLMARRHPEPKQPAGTIRLF